MSRRVLTLALTVWGCGATPPGPTPADGVSAAAGRVPLYVPGMLMLHQVALDMPGRSDVMVGRMRFPAPERYHLQAQTPFGLDLFTLAYDGARYRTEVADPLKGRFPADALAREIGRIYLHACATPTERDATLVCEGLIETLDPRTYAVVRRRFRVGEREVDIRYGDYRWYGERWLAERVVLTSGDYRVEVVLTEVSQARP